MKHPWCWKIVLAVLVLLECCFLLAAFSRFPINRSSAARALFEWRQNPSPQTEAAWNSERGRLRRDELIIDGVVWVLIITTGAGIFYVFKRQRLGSTSRMQGTTR